MSKETMVSIRGIKPDGLLIDVKVSGDKIVRVLGRRKRRVGRLFGGEEVCISPGFIDLQVNGFAGIDFNHPDLEGDDLVAACRAILRTGVTRFCPTLITASHERLARNIRQIVRAYETHPLVRLMVLGIHLEGPYIAPEDGPRGAHPRAHVRDPNWEEFTDLLSLSKGLVRMITLAPERPGALEFIRNASEAGQIVAIGHCAPEPACIDAAVEAGAVLSTHLGNGAHQTLPRHANYIQKQLSHDGLMASMICDGEHLPEYFVKNLVRAKGSLRTILVSDAVAAAASPPGRYTLGELEVEVGEDRIVRLSGTPYLAGSALTLDQAVGNCARFARIPLASAIKLVTSNPAKLLKETHGMLEPGERADVVLFRLIQGRIRIHQVFLAGKLTFSRRSEAPRPSRQGGTEHPADLPVNKSPRPYRRGIQKNQEYLHSPCHPELVSGSDLFFRF